MGAQMLAETYGLGPFHAGGGGGGGGCSTGASGGGGGADCATTHVSVPGSSTVPKPHSVALLTEGEANVVIAKGVTATATPNASRRMDPPIAELPSELPRPRLTRNPKTDWQSVSAELTIPKN